MSEVDVDKSAVTPDVLNKLEAGKSWVGALAENYANFPVIRALLQLIPFWGLPDVLLEARAQQLHSKRLFVFFEALAASEIVLREDVIRSESFLHAYFCTVRAVLNTSRREKIENFAKLLVGFRGYESDVDGFEEILGILDSISFREYSVLLLLRSYEESHPVGSAENSLMLAEKFWKEFTAEACASFNLTELEFDPYVKRLERTGLYSEFVGMYLGYHGGRGATTELFSKLLQYIRTEGTNGVAKEKPSVHG